MKYQVSELECGELDAAVAQALKYPFKILSDGFCTIGFGSEFLADPLLNGEPFEPSSDWAFGGPIIGRERIAVVFDGRVWDAYFNGRYTGPDGQVDCSVALFSGPTLLVAAMRAFVGGKSGEEVEL